MMIGRMVEAARHLRRHGTCSERILWEALRDRRLDGVRWKRQQPIGRFVVDFIAPAARLVVEIDGPVHDDRADLDGVRQALLEKEGLHFVRLRSVEIERNLSCALARIRAALSVAGA
jgi:very-short-patch-repair endonuclease